MSDFTSQERQAAARAIAEAMAVDAAPTSLDFAAASINPKKLFCDNWPMVRTVLEVLKTLVPAPIGAIIGVVITAGNAAHSAICS